MTQITIPKGFKVSAEQFDQLADCLEDTQKLELTSDGELVIMSPTGGDTGRKNGDLFASVWNWAKQDGTGVCFDSSTLFIFPNGARRSPDVSWILKSRWNQLSLESKRKFSPLAPDFVIELVSPSDGASSRYKDLQTKMQEYIDNGVRLGWLINPDAKTVEIYRVGQVKEVLQSPYCLSGEDILVNFTLDLAEIF
jgi:Uma2 family endonuclease